MIAVTKLCPKPNMRVTDIGYESRNTGNTDIAMIQARSHSGKHGEVCSQSGAHQEKLRSAQLRVNVIPKSCVHFRGHGGEDRDICPPHSKVSGLLISSPASLSADQRSWANLTRAPGSHALKTGSAVLCCSVEKEEG